MFDYDPGPGVDSHGQGSFVERLLPDGYWQ